MSPAQPVWIPSPYKCPPKDNTTGSHLLTGGQDRTVRLWNPRKADPSAACLATFRDGRLSHPVADIAVMPGSRQFATCGGTTQALLWDLKTKQLVRKMSGHSLRVNCVAEGAQGAVLVTGGYDRSVCVHDLRSRGTIQTMERRQPTPGTPTTLPLASSWKPN